MNKILKGKFLPKDFSMKNVNLKHNFIIQYVSNYYDKEDKPFIFNIIQRTDSYNNDPKVKELVDKHFAINNNTESIQNNMILESSNENDLGEIVQNLSTSLNELGNEERLKDLSVEENNSVQTTMEINTENVDLATNEIDNSLGQSFRIEHDGFNG